ncbi:MAG: DNA methyltransferase [Candidatus Nanopusillus acidilobi]
MVVQIINGNALEELKKLQDESVDCIITSPPYYGLRAYKGAETDWGDWQGQLGLEPTYQMYLQHLLLITAELKRVLKKTGALFWNMGDSYASEGGPSRHKGYSDPKWPKARNGSFDEPTSYPQGIKPKSLMMLPERFAIGMLEQGWILRNKIVWFKPNGLPSSVKDRFTNKWEYIFFFVKSKKYYFDLDAVRVPLKQSSINRIRQNIIDQFIDTKVSDFPDQNMNIKNILLHMHSKYLKDRETNGSLAGRVMRNIADGKLETFVREAITNVNQYLKDKLKESGLTVKQLAEMTGEKDTMIAHYFRTDLSGAALPSREFWDKAKDILNLDEYDEHIKEEYKSVLPLFDKGANPGDVIHEKQKYEEEGGGYVGKHSGYLNADGSLRVNLNGANPGDIIPYHPKGDPTFGMRLPPQPWQEHAFNPNGANPGDFLNVPTRPHSFAHFAVYPVTLIAPLVKVGCPSGGTVLDPFAGSGTTGVVAEILGRNSILIEISKEYIDIINWRLQPENLEKEKKVIMNNNISL